MLFRIDALEGIAAGTVTVAFRRWDRPRVRVGGRQRSALGVVEFTSVEAVTDGELVDGQISEADARAAGMSSVTALEAELGRRSGTVYRIGLRHVGDDPRATLRATVPDGDELVEIRARLDRLDRASRRDPWTRAVLVLIAERPGVPAAGLAEALGRERLPFKQDVRKLKDLGLTESLEVGYRLSPRGEAVLAGW